MRCLQCLHPSTTASISCSCVGQLRCAVVNVVDMNATGCNPRPWSCCSTAPTACTDASVCITNGLLTSGNISTGAATICFFNSSNAFFCSVAQANCTDVPVNFVSGAAMVA